MNNPKYKIDQTVYVLFQDKEVEGKVFSIVILKTDICYGIAITGIKPPCNELSKKESEVYDAPGVAIKEKITNAIEALKEMLANLETQLEKLNEK